jgi:hypothetical protein
LTIMIKVGDQGTTDDLLSLFAYLQATEELDGALQLRSDSSNDHLGLADAVWATIEASGLPALISAVAGWLRGRGSEIKVTFTRVGSYRTLELSAKRVRQADVAALHEILNELSTALAAGESRDQPPD